MVIVSPSGEIVIASEKLNSEFGKGLKKTNKFKIITNLNLIFFKV